jgi:hypothetical protein
MAHVPQASLNLLSQMLVGIQHPSFLSDDEPTFSAKSISTLPESEDAVEVVLISPSGDHFRITVEWLKDDSP